MARKAIREFDAKRLFSKGCDVSYKAKVVLVGPETNLNSLKRYKWLLKERLVVKPDQLFGRRGKHGLILLNAKFTEVIKFIKNYRDKEIKIGKAKGKLKWFLIEPYVKHEKEHYIAIQSFREYDEIYFSSEGGVSIEELLDKVKKLKVKIGENPSKKEIEKLFTNEKGNEKNVLIDFIKKLYKFYVDYYFTFLEINPFTIVNKKIIPLDFVARLDDTAEFWCKEKWGRIDFPAPFGKELTKEEEYIKKLDEMTGASLKLTILNPNGRVWTMIAGGGASVIYTDTIVDLSYKNELANYGEYSGNPSTYFTYLYAKTIINLMTRKKDQKGRSKILIIGGGVANFTDVAKTFKGIIMALKEYKEKLRKVNVKIYVRRGGPNYKDGLKLMKEVGEEIGIPVKVYGPELHMTRIVKIALGDKK